MPIQGLTDLTKLGEIVETGLPNLVGSFTEGVGGGSTKVDGALFTDKGNVGSATTSHLDYDGAKIEFNAQSYNPIYGNSDTVQQEQIQYPYFIQVATGASVQDNITNEVELNNPFVLLEGHYFTAPVYNSSWLQSNAGFTGSLALHPTAYNALLIEQNPNVEVGTTIDNYTKRGLSVKLDTEAYTDYDFVLNTTSQTFRCPLKINKASGRAVVGNGKTLGITDGTNNAGLKFTTASGARIYGTPELYGKGVGTTSTSGTGTTNDKSVGITTDPTKSGIETSDNGLYLYFFVGETVQNANLLNVGRVEEKVASLIPDNSSVIARYAMPSDKYIDLTLGASGSTYTAPANGWLVFCKAANAAGQYIQLNGTITSLGYRNNMLVGGDTPTNGYLCYCYMPMAKGQSTAVYYNAGGNTMCFRFIYAEGEV
jgi:hypothetical protein